MNRKLLLFTVLLSLAFSCTTYYKANQEFNYNFESGNIETADKVLAGVKKIKKSKATSLYYMNRGVVSSMLGEYEVSNQYFEQAYTFLEDQRLNYFNEALALVSNPMMAEYRPEDHEELLIHYYKALNFIKLDQKESALVEARRMDIKLQAISDKYRSDKKYQRDAMITMLMGLVYDANGESNNAFIAYRNAYNIYVEDYERLFGFSAPQQLKRDLIRTAYQTGFFDEGRQYEEKFGMKHEPAPRGSGDVIFFWHNGLGPIKAEWSINFFVKRGSGGTVVFFNEELGLNFAFAVSDDDYAKSGLGSIGVLRVAFPKYVERPALYSGANIKANGKNYPLELTEDVNAIAFKSLQQRMLKELGTSLLRLGLKKGSEYAVRQENEGLGAVLGIFNAITEKADTRNWQTLPHSIYYTRITLPAGEQTLQLFPYINRNRPGFNASQKEIKLNVQSNSTAFFTHHTLDIDPGFRIPFN